VKELKFDFDDVPKEELPRIIEDSLIEKPSEIKIKRKKVTREYINNADFCAALEKYKEHCATAKTEGKIKPRIPNYIGECFVKLSEGLARRPNFFGYSYKDEMIADGIENCLMYFENFDSGKTKNPFAYFTQILWWCFVRRIQKEKKQQYIKYKATENFGILDAPELLGLGDGHTKQIEVYDNMYDFIRKFEETEFNKGAKTPAVKKKKKAKGIETFLED